MFVPGQGQFRQQLCFDLMQLRDKEEDDDDTENGDGQGNEPVTSHGMRPARGWASFNILPVRPCTSFVPRDVFVFSCFICFNFIVDFFVA